MADYDRGAYTPQTDAPLAFDPRRPSERRPMPMALIGSAVVLVVLLAGVAMVYRSGVRHAGEAPRPVGEPVMSVKTAPAPGTETASRAAPANLDVYNAGSAPAAAATSNTTSNTTAEAGPTPVFAPPVEQPTARPAPKPSTLAMLAKPQAPAVRRPTPAQSEAAKIAEDAQVKPTAAASATTPSPSPVRAAVAHPVAKPRPVDDSEVAAAGMTRASVARKADDDDSTAPAPPLRKALPPPAKVAAATPTTAKAAPATSPAATETTPVGAVVQIGAFSSDALATKGYADVSGVMAGQMAGKSRRVAPLQRDGKTLYRTWVAGFGSRADAAAFCDALKAKGKICIVKG